MNRRTSPRRLTRLRPAWTDRVAVALLLATLAGCSSCPPFRASWYLEDAPTGTPATSTAPAMPVLYLALLNEGQQAVSLTDVVVNPQRSPLLPTPGGPPPAQRPPEPMVLLPRLGPDAPSTLTSDANVVGAAPRFVATTWRPGQLLVFRVADPVEVRDAAKEGPATEGGCILPVAVEIQCGDRCRKTQAVSATLPNYLHPAWVQRCQPMQAPPKTPGTAS